MSNKINKLFHVKQLHTKQKQTIEAYDQGASFYAEQFDKYGIRKTDIDRALSYLDTKKPKVLEIGCGNGRDAYFVTNKEGYTCNYLGIDASAELVKIAKEKNPKLMFHVKDFTDFDYKEGEFDLIYSFYTLLHVEREVLHETLLKILKSLKIGGILYISTKFGPYRELEIENLGHKKYYYPYEPTDLLKVTQETCDVLFQAIHDSEYGPAFTLALKKIR